MPDFTKTFFQKIKSLQYKSYTAAILITCILIAAHLSFGILAGYKKLGIAIGTSFLVEIIMGRLFLGKWRNLSSAYISGISVGILIRSPMFWPYALCSALSISSKYVLRYKGRHIWNPSNFGVVAMLILASNSVAVLSIQWGNNLWPMLVIWVIGSYSIWKIKRFHICATYVISFLVFALFRSWITGDPYLAEISPITGPMYQLFVFFMITDPRTTVQAKWGQYAVPFAIAFLEFILRLNEFVYAPFYALFIVGPTAMYLELWWKSRAQTQAVQS